MSYLLFCAFKEMCISCGRYGNVKLPTVCKLCQRIEKQYVPGFHQERLQTTTSTKPGVFLKQIKKLKKKKGNCSDVIEVSNSAGGDVKVGKTIIKRTSTTEILKRLGVPSESFTKPSSPVKVTSKEGIDSTNYLPYSKKQSSFNKCETTDHLQPILECDDASEVTPISSTSEEMTMDGSSNVLIKDVLQAKENDDIETKTLTFDETYSLPQSFVSSDFSDDANLPVHLHGSGSEEFVSNPLHKSKRKSSSVIRKNAHSSINNKMFKVEQKAIEEQSRCSLLKASLRSYLDVCVNSNLVNVAHKTLCYYISKDKKGKSSHKVVDTKLFNIVLSGASQQGNLTCVQQLLSLMRSEGIQLNLQSYVAYLSCLGRFPNLRKDLVQRVIKDIHNDGLNLADLDKQCFFVDGEREYAIKAIQVALPDFSPDSPFASDSYICSLVSSLNTKVPHWYNPLGSCANFEDLVMGVEAQLSRELSGDIEIKSVIKQPELSEKLINAKRLLHAYEEAWGNVLLESFQNRVKSMSKYSQGHNNEKYLMLYPFLIALDPSDYVKVMLEEIKHLAESSETFSLPKSTLHTTVGAKVMAKYLVKLKKKQGIVEKIELLCKKYSKYFADPNLTSQCNPRQYWQKLHNEHRIGPTVDTWDVWWPSHILCGVGKFLYDVIIQDVKINVNYLRSSSKARPIPAFYTIYRNSGVKVKEEIKPHPVLVKLFRTSFREQLVFSVSELPMLSPPVPWVSITSGGYLLSSAKFIRLSSAAAHQKLLLESTPNQQLFPIFDTLNQLGECPWIINKPVLDIIIQMFNDNGNEALEISPPSSECPPLPSVSQDMSNAEKAKVYQERNKLKQKKAEMHSLWCDTLYKLSIANHYKDRVFWFPHNLDFRGRVYPCPPHFNHLGSDMTRSVLLFAKGEPLGEKGLDWLKLQVINFTGLKKRGTIRERSKYANEMMPEILDSADRPLTGNMWWQKSDEPWQTLACCMEVAKAVRSPDPTKYVCHFPIHQDGSCNGLQHYAALGRDQHGAEQVNLYPHDSPQDVYSGVASLVEKLRQEDAAKGIEIAKILEGHVQRKVIKQTVMTTVYGVTRYGARLQIVKQLKDLEDFPQDKAFSAAYYLAHKTFQSLQQMFTSAKLIQDWFTESARHISQTCGLPVEWVTPLGLPVVQPYHRTRKGAIPFGSGQMSNYLSMDINQRPNVIKQRNAFPPNFIHSLDSTHMMLTSLFCQRAGITFVSVHDCFWTHPSTVHIMNKICREQFVSLHNQPILENLSEFLFTKYSYGNQELPNDGSVVDARKKRLNRTLKDVPTKGNYDLENVLKSTYFFS